MPFLLMYDYLFKLFNQLDFNGIVFFKFTLKNFPYRNNGLSYFFVQIFNIFKWF